MHQQPRINHVITSFFVSGVQSPPDPLQLYRPRRRHLLPSILSPLFFDRKLHATVIIMISYIGEMVTGQGGHQWPRSVWRLWRGSVARCHLCHCDEGVDYCFYCRPQLCNYYVEQRGIVLSLVDRADVCLGGHRREMEDSNINESFILKTLLWKPIRRTKGIEWTPYGAVHALSPVMASLSSRIQY